MPFSTLSCEAGTPSFWAAPSTRTRRASAAALRSKRTPFETPVLPEAPPWLQEVAVSPISTATLSNPTSSSSATTWATATSRPWPMSILPKKAFTRPSGRTAIQESSSVGTSGGLPAVVCARTSLVENEEEQTTNAPLAFRNSRRDTDVISPSSRHLRLRALDSAQDRHVGAAAAFQAGERVAQLGVARFGVLPQDRGGGHDPAVDAVAALRHLLRDVGGLQRMRLGRRAEALDGGHLLARHGRERHHAGAHRLAVEVDRAGPALRQAAAEVRIVHAEIVAQRVQQRHLGLGVHLHALAVDREVEARHVSSSGNRARQLEQNHHFAASVAGLGNGIGLGRLLRLVAMGDLRPQHA